MSKAIKNMKNMAPKLCKDTGLGADKDAYAVTKNASVFVCIICCGHVYNLSYIWKDVEQWVLSSDQFKCVQLSWYCHNI